MTKIAFIGHEEERFSNKSKLDNKISNTVAILKRDRNNCIFLLNGSSGISDRIYSNISLENHTRFKLFLPFSPQIYREMQMVDRAECLEKQMLDKWCSGIYIDNPSFNKESFMNRNTMMIDECNTLFAFWLNKHIGETYETIKYAISCNKQVFNAYSDDIVAIDGKSL